MLPSVRLFVCLSVCLTDRCIIEKRSKLTLRNFHSTVCPSLEILQGKFLSRNSKGFPQAGASNKVGVGQISSFLSLRVNISKTVADTAKVTMTNRKYVTQGYPLTPRSMTLDDLELL